MFWMTGTSGHWNIAVAENSASTIAQLQSLLHGEGVIGEASAARVRAFGIRPAATASRLLTLPRPGQTSQTPQAR